MYCFFCPMHEFNTALLDHHPQTSRHSFTTRLLLTCIKSKLYFGEETTDAIFSEIARQACDLFSNGVLVSCLLSSLFDTPIRQIRPTPKTNLPHPDLWPGWRTASPLRLHWSERRLGLYEESSLALDYILSGFGEIFFGSDQLENRNVFAKRFGSTQGFPFVDGVAMYQNLSFMYRSWMAWSYRCISLGSRWTRAFPLQDLGSTIPTNPWL